MDCLPQRKQTRLKGYDYSQNGAYFITMCTHDRTHLFGEIVGAIHESTVCELTKRGYIAKSVIESLSDLYTHVKITDYVIMPNHIHLIIEIAFDVSAIRESPQQGKRSIISKIIGYMKMNISKQIHEIDCIVEIWQRGYHDHIIRNYDEYLLISNYIQTNPSSWEKDKIRLN